MIAPAVIFSLYFAVVSRYYSYLNSAKEILSLYKGEEPFNSFVKKFFSLNKKYGSADRKQIAHLCYCYFRMGKALNDFSMEEKIMAGLFMCSSNSNELLHNLRPEWNDKAGLPVQEKSVFINSPGIEKNIFPWDSEISKGIEFEKFNLSFLEQPNLFLRIRPGNEQLVKEKLQRAAIAFVELTPICISLANTSAADKIINLNREAVIQDLSSQRVGDLFHLIKTTTTLRVWDCCAASGGKSILAKDMIGNIDLTVSDIRESILINLRKRFTEAGIKKYKSFIADLAKPARADIPGLFDLIIADAPCTGSGTWGRTPEQLFYFEKGKTGQYVSLQRSITENAVMKLKPGGYLLYITCSVFKKENEEIVAFLKEKFHFDIVKMELLKGYEEKADTMFAALLRLPL